MISLAYIGLIDLCVLCVSVVPSTSSLGGMYLRVHFTHQTQESRHWRGMEAAIPANCSGELLAKVSSVPT
ncbi:MAG: hypothetical protein EWV76_20245 [Microcystis novacekii Mn_MB_F_20050700_S1]|uniref:Uncharacterized protein n=1 Tax=Microcystis novacekii Mn_MB_F_20050700_S1D TaxID=2486266 RepID=A0A552IJ43_9CHRO|nr:MAG: hypothetical protein EWV76_20245 [Microcystis novacekii Mn_MB_F_20050700_S1]TRU83491.1 MAG: hypothetical protein EWV54_20005 [Microcystis novacekii Mn_MB_F_20050700_S1D]